MAVVGRTFAGAPVRRKAKALCIRGPMLKLHYYDANCLIKLVIAEAGSDELRAHFYSTGIVSFTTSFCFYEALGVLKAKWIGKSRPDQITQEQYLAACEELCALVDDQNLQIEEQHFYDREAFSESERIVQTYGLDLSDAFQLVTLRSGMIARLAITITPELISEDKDLRNAAKSEGLSVLSISML